MSTRNRLRAFHRYEEAFDNYKLHYDLVFSGRKAPFIQDAKVEEQGTKGTPLNHAFLELKNADKEWRETIR